MDLNAAIQTAEAGVAVRDDATMTADWTVRYVRDERLLYYFDPKGTRKHRVQFSDAQRASYRWRIVDEPKLQT